MQDEDSSSTSSGAQTPAAPTPSILGDDYRAKVEGNTERCPHIEKAITLTASVRGKILNPSRWSCRWCPTSADVWACLTCGQIGCGSEVKSHASAHFKKSKHPIAMDINGQKACIW